MYKIIGKDGQTIRTASADEMRRWLAQNQINAQTLVQAEGSLDWKPLSAFDEFAADLRVPPLGPRSHPSPRRPPWRSAKSRLARGICSVISAPSQATSFHLEMFWALLIWQIKKNEIPSVEEHGKAAPEFPVHHSDCVVYRYYRRHRAVLCVHWVPAVPGGYCHRHLRDRFCDNRRHQSQQRRGLSLSLEPDAHPVANCSGGARAVPGSQHVGTGRAVGRPGPYARYRAADEPDGSRSADTNSCPKPKAAIKAGEKKRQGTGAVQDANARMGAQDNAPAFWTAVVLYRFSLRLFSSVAFDYDPDQTLLKKTP